MKRIFNLKQHLNYERVLFCALVFVLSFLSTNVNTIHNAMGQVSAEEPYITLNVKNKPLGDVLKKISEDTGYKFKLNDQWSGYSVYASLENMPLHQVLKRILSRLNYAIIYESDKSINIVIYGEADTRKINQYPIQSFSSQIPKYPQELEPSPELPPEKAGDLERADESSSETGASENSEEKSTEKKDSLEKFNFLKPFYDFVVFTNSNGCNCKMKQKEKLIEDRFETLKTTTPNQVWIELEKYLNGSS